MQAPRILANSLRLRLALFINGHPAVDVGDDLAHDEVNNSPLPGALKLVLDFDDEGGSFIGIEGLQGWTQVSRTHVHPMKRWAAC